ncbi:substrate-binding domain-containing protein [Piscinibacter sp.]|uniref:substrate-binding domain-containing protein n=1 Tax=Piscinibacter sp. TaxID=1903157 RepID=UPI002B7FFE9F|nr:substrate-binding domain-containing protein [Albitalea sp.]HUG22796.1 substrate-binding domain-containing protein [Albitalea sp.]
MNARRRVLIRLSAAAAALACPAWAPAVQRQSLADPLRLAADDALVDSGLAGSLQRAFGRDTGVVVQLVRGPASALLDALERGEHDAALTNAPEREIALEKQGLVHDRRAVVAGGFVLVGPLVLAKPLAAERDAAMALSRIAQAQVPFLTRGDGCGTHLAELRLWRAAEVLPAAPWYQNAAADAPLLTQARERQAVTLVERGVWAAQGGARGYGVLVHSDPRMALDVHVMRTFRVQHPAGKLFVNWLAGPKGRRLAAAHLGYRAVRS